MMVAAPLSTLDMALSSGQQVTIEERPESEVLGMAGQAIAAVGASAWNPAFDVTPAALVDYLVTEAGVISAPSEEKLAILASALTADAKNA